MKHRSSKNRFNFTGQAVSGMRVEGMQGSDLELSPKQRRRQERRLQTPISAVILDGPQSFDGQPSPSAPEEGQRATEAFAAMNEPAEPVPDDNPVIPNSLQ